MSDARALLEQALDNGDPAEADRLAVQAILADPDLGPAYAVRGRIAASRGDPIVAAHHFRAAFARGDRSPTTRAALALCLEAGGQEKVAEQVRAGAATTPALEAFADVVQTQAAAIKQILLAPLPPRGAPALLPGEKGTPAPSAVKVERVTRKIRPSAAPSPPPAARPAESSRPPEARPAETSRPVVAQAPVSQKPELVQAVITGPKVVHRARTEVAPWLETFALEARAEVEVEQAEWVDDLDPGRGSWHDGEGARFDTSERLELVADPGVASVSVRSPVTGREVRPQDIAAQRADAAMPELGERPDALEAAAALVDHVDEPLLCAVRLPGPVMTAHGMEPRKLCKRVAFGLTRTEVVLRDLTNDKVPLVRLPVVALARVEVVGIGDQLSFGLADGRQVHLDLRRLRRRALPAARDVIAAVEEVVQHLSTEEEPA